jgi:type VI secretion system protein ImpC
MPGHLRFEIAAGSRTAPARRRADDAPMRILLCGDFSGRGGRGLDESATLATRPVLRVDADNLDALFIRLAPSVELPAEGEAIAIAFAAIDDFHPDRLFDHLDLFSHPRALRRRLLDPASFQQASAELLGPGAESDAATMQRLLGRSAPAVTPPAAPRARTAAAAVDALLRQFVSGDAVPDIGSRQAQLVGAIDLAIADQMRRVLHHPRFQSVEAAWRTVQFLMNRLELDDDLQLHLFDVTRAELDAAAAEPDLERSGLWKVLVERQRDVGGPGWSMVVALETFGPSHAEVSLLASLATAAAATGAPLVATAAPSLFGCDVLSLTPDHHDWQPLDADDQSRWQALRRSVLAPWIGLVAPRLLLRLPYGKTTDPLERFAFDEMAGADPARALLWGHPGVACALLAGLAFRDSGWQMDLDAQLDLEDLPAWIYTEDGERHLYPCAEAWLGERAGQALLERGLMPLLSRRDRPAARLMRWQSIAEPAAALAGPWGG